MISHDVAPGGGIQLGSLQGTQAFFVCAAGIDSLEGKVGIHIEQDNSRLLGTFPGKPGQEQSVRMSTQAPQHQRQ